MSCLTDIFTATAATQTNSLLFALIIDFLPVNFIIGGTDDILHKLRMQDGGDNAFGISASSAYFLPPSFSSVCVS